MESRDASLPPSEHCRQLVVAHIVLSLDVGGLERVVLNLARHGKELGIRSEIICLERPGTLAAVAEESGAAVHSLGKAPGVSFRVKSKLRQVLTELAPDVVHTHQIGALFYAGPAARRAGVRLVVHTEHGKHYATGIRRRILARLAGRYADRFFCVSEDIASSIKSLHIAAADRIQVIRNGIDTALYRQQPRDEELKQSLGIPHGAPVIGTVGRLNEVKRQDLLIDAFALLKVAVPDAHLVLVGDGPLCSQLERRSQSLGVATDVHFAGYQSQPQRYLSIMDVFAITSRSEGMPLSILEAWAAGIPVVASRVGGLPEMIDHERTGILFDFADTPGLAKSLERLLQDPMLRRTIGSAAQAHVIANFDVRTMAELYHRHYETMLRDRLSSST